MRSSMSTNSILEKRFFEEVQKRAGWANAHIQELEKNPDNKEVLYLLFQDIHPVRGLAIFLDMANIERVVSPIEKYLDDRLHDTETLSTGNFELLKKMICEFNNSLAVSIKDIPNSQHFQINK